MSEGLMRLPWLNPLAMAPPMFPAPMMLTFIPDLFLVQGGLFLYWLLSAQMGFQLSQLIGCK